MNMHKNMAHCIDINSPYCPCLLAQTNHCVACSQLQGHSVCDCNWAGVCILYEKHWQSKQKRWRNGDDEPVRIEVDTEFDIKEQISDNTYLLELGVTYELAQQLKKVGSFVFLRRPHDPQFYHFPVGVMKVLENRLQVVIETDGPKSTRLIEGNNRQILVRGPYYNGIFGQPWIDNITCGKIVLVAGGIGQAPGLPIAVKLTANKNEVMAVLAPGKVGKVFIEDQLHQAGIVVQTVASMRREGMELLKEWLVMKPDLVVSAGSDDQHYGVIEAMQLAGVNVPMVATNNATMCCGEGICGSCQKETRDNKSIRTCKVQTDFSELIHE
jgi:NAD(P)H-flavin reductase